MDTASGQAGLTGSTKRTRRRFLINPLALGILALIVVLAFGSMVLVLSGIYPPSSPQSKETIAQAWQTSRTATPAAQRADMLKVEKVGPATRQGNDVVVKLRVTNNVMQSPPLTGTVQPNEPTPPAEQAKVFNGTIRVFFYKVNNGEQQIVGSGIGNITNLAFGQSQEVTVLASGVGDFTDYVAFTDSVWTDKDPVKVEDTPAPASGATPTP